jgi:hypothetical protein
MCGQDSEGVTYTADGEYDDVGEMPCGMNLCCSASGWCGVGFNLDLLSLQQTNYRRPQKPSATTPTPSTGPYLARPVTVLATSPLLLHAQRVVVARTAGPSVTTNLGTYALESATPRLRSNSTRKASPTFSTHSPSSIQRPSRSPLPTTMTSSRCVSLPIFPRTVISRLG